MSGTGISTRPTERPPQVRSLVLGLVCVLSVVGGVFAVQSVPRWQWADRCREGGGRVVSHASGHEPYLAHGSAISWTCEGAPPGVATSWP